MATHVFAAAVLSLALMSPTEQTLDKLLAPVALYPDQLLAQMLMCATEPDKVTDLHGWLKSNQTVKGTALQDAAVTSGFEPSFVALVLFPDIVATMAAKIEWTTQVGKAFAADRSSVFAAIQRLRRQAQDVGNLKSTPQQEVSTKKTSGGEQVIVIEPSNPQVVYVPQYNTEVIYTQAPSTTVIVEDDDDDEAIAAVIGFTAGIAIGAAFDNNYYYGPHGWYGGGYMYNDAWDDYYDAREDARDDWMDHREDLYEERGDLAEDRSEQRTDRRESTQEQRTDRRETTQEQRTERRESSQGQRTERTTERTGSAEARGYGGGERASQRSGGSDAFSGYSSGTSQRSASARGRQSRGASRGGGRGRR